MKKTIAFASLLFFLCSCLKNDAPLPYVIAKITSLSAEGALNVVCDENTRKVTIDLDEPVDVENVKITSCSFNDSLVKPLTPIVGLHDLSSPVFVTLRTYQDYEWSIGATQKIERYMSVKSQIGATIIDEANRRIILKVAKNAPLTWLTVKDFKLGPRDITTYDEDILKIKDFSSPVTIHANYRDISEEWTVYVSHSDLSVYISAVSPRVTCCYMKAEAPEGADNGFRYRKKGDTDWKQADTLMIEGGTVTAYLDSLTANTSYECLAYTGSEETPVQEFTTGESVQLPNSGFEVFSQAESENFYSFYDPASALPECRTKWWDDGNVGSTTVGSSFSITQPDTEDFKEGKASAHLISRYVIIKFAAGNLFCGEFAGLVGTSGGIVHFGQPFTSRPRAFKMWVKYKNGVIDNFNGCPTDTPVAIGDPDIGQIYVALGNWDYRKYGGSQQHPVCVNTTDKSTFFNPRSDAVIAYGTFKTNKPTDGWQELEIPLEYRDNYTIPTHIIVSCASSALGDYFTGSSESQMWIDDFRLVY